MKKKSAKRTVRASLRATKKFVEKLGGRSVPASGAGLEKGDGRVHGRFRIETKCPPTGSYRLTFEDWEKVRDAAVRANEVPVFHIKLGPMHEIVFLHEKDYRGLGGDRHTEAHLGSQIGHTIDVHTWIGFRVIWRHINLAVHRGKKVYELRCIPHTDFIELAERAK